MSPHFLAQRRAVQAEQLGGGGAVPLAVFKHGGQERRLHELQEPLIELRIVRRRELGRRRGRPARDLALRPGVRGDGGGVLEGRGFWEVLGTNLATTGNDRRVFHG